MQAIKELFAKLTGNAEPAQVSEPVNTKVRVLDSSGKEIESTHAKIERAREELNARLRVSAERGRYKPKLLGTYISDMGVFNHMDNNTLEPVGEPARTFAAHQSLQEWKQFQRVAIAQIKNPPLSPICLKVETNIIEQ